MLDAIKNFIARYFDSKANKWIKYEEEIHYLRNQIGFYQSEIKRLTDLLIEFNKPKEPERVVISEKELRPIGKIPWQVHANKLREEENKRYEMAMSRLPLTMNENKTTEQLENELAVND